MRTARILILLLVAAGLHSTIAATPQLLNYQGRLTDAAGEPVDGTVDLVFTIYADQSGTTALWTETHAAVDVTDGLFSVLLGSVASFGSSVFNGSERWLKITVDGTPSSELVPIVSVAYAQRAQVSDSSVAAAHAVRADTANYAPGAGGGWTDDGSVVRLGTVGDKVGIGTTTPVDKVEIESSEAGGGAFLRIQASYATNWGETGLRIETPQNRWHLRMDDDSNNNIPDGALGLRSQNGGFEVMTWTLDGKIGIHKTEPEYPLDVVSTDVAVRGYTTGGYATAGLYGRAEYDAFGVMGTSTSGRGVYGASTSGFGCYFTGPKNYLSSKVGIGTESPTHTLTVNGTVAVQEAGATKFHIDYYNNGLDFCEEGAADYRLMLKAGGNVGIGTGSPQKKLHVAGSAKVDDTLTAGAIFSTSIVDEPGITTAAASVGYIATMTYDTVLSGRIEVPGPGHIWIMATASAAMDHGDVWDLLYYGISNAATSIPGDRDNMCALGPDVNNGYYRLPLACMTLWTVGSAGTYQYYFVARVTTSDANVTVYDGKMTLIYFPTLYSAKGDEVSAEVAEPSLSAGQLTELDRSRVGEDTESSKVAALEAEVSALRSRLEALEQKTAKE